MLYVHLIRSESGVEKDIVNLMIIECLSSYQKKRWKLPNVLDIIHGILTLLTVVFILYTISSNVITLSQSPDNIITIGDVVVLNCVLFSRITKKNHKQVKILALNIRDDTKYIL